MNNRLKFLGTGASFGTPVVGCKCDVCSSSSPMNKRLRPSVLITFNEKQLLVDTTPDFRLQALTYGITHLDGVILTHAHYDHINGLDELRIFYFLYHKPTPCLVSKETLEELKIRYHYLMPPFKADEEHDTKLQFHLMEEAFGSIDFVGVPIEYVSYSQVGMKVNGIKIQDFAYLTDIKEYSPSLFKHLQGVKCLVISGLKQEESRAHLGIMQAIDFAKKLGVEEVFLTHIAHEVDHEKMSHDLPKGVQLAYDGLEISL